MKLFSLLISVPALVGAVAVGSEPAAGIEAFNLEARNCNAIGPCWSNGCDPKFKKSTDTIGTCKAGRYKGCKCNKCDGKTGLCNRNGCEGKKGICQKGNYKGCRCK